MPASRSALGEALVELLASKLSSERATPQHDVPTVFEAAHLWLAAKQRRGLETRDNDAHLRLHISPVLGAMLLPEVKPHHVAEFIERVRATVKAPRTVLHISATGHAMFAWCVAQEMIASNPWLLARGALPPNVDADPFWRATAVRDRATAELLISDPRVPLDRQVLYGLKLNGLRHGEAARLRFCHIVARTPLYAAVLVKTKTRVPRDVPLHPTIAALLQEWWERGFASHFGRAPTPGELVVPSRRGNVRAAPTSQRMFLWDCRKLGLARGRGHDLRRTFVSLARADGADPHILEWVTHGPRGSIVDLYTTYPWEALCREVCKLRLERHGTPRQLELRFLHALPSPSEPAAGLEPATCGLRNRCLAPEPVVQPSDSVACGRRRRKPAV